MRNEFARGMTGIKMNGAHGHTKRIQAIDGLRAIAVLGVIGYHFFVKLDGTKIVASDMNGQLLSGGFLGVDIFFVISGFLISRNLKKQVESTTRINFRQFYANRLSRLFPALASLLVVVSLVSWMLLGPSSLKNFADSALSAATGTANWFFASQESYWSESSRTSPLLHLWSLAVEEQFYLIWPLALLVLHNSSRFIRPRFGINVLLGTSLLLNALAGSINSQWDFYSTTSRAWEFLLGALVAYLPAYAIADRCRPSLRHFGSASALLAIFICFFAVDETFEEQAPGKLVVTTATAILIILASKKTAANALLEFRVFTFLGLISYSLYLWHWPILVFFRVSGATSMWMALILMFAIGIGSYFLMEKPAFWRGKRVQRGLAISVLTILALAGSNALLVHRTDGGLFRFGISKRLWNDIDTRASMQPCMANLTASLNEAKNCRLLGEEGKSPGVGLFGDSHAEALASGMDVWAKNRTEAVILVKSYSCPPIQGLLPVGPPQYVRDCLDALDLQNKLVASRTLEKVYLVARWELVFGSQPRKFLIATGDRLGEPATEVDLVKALKGTLDNLHDRGIEVVVVGQVPVQTVEPKRFYLDLANRSKRPSDNAGVEILNASISSVEAVEKMKKINNELVKVTQSTNVPFIDPIKALCKVKCAFGTLARSYYVDSTHLSDVGARRFMALAKDQFR